MKFLRPTTFASLVLLCFACQPVDPLKDITISIDLNIFKTYVSFRFADAQTGELIGRTDNQPVFFTVAGPDAQAVVLQTGERPDEFVSVSGMISVALDPYDPYTISSDNPVSFSFEASSAGYQTTRSSLILTETGTHTCLVAMRPIGQTGSGMQSYTVLPGEVREGILPEGFLLIAPDNAFELEFPDSLDMLTEQGTPADGNLSVRATTYSGLQHAGIGATGVMQFQGDDGVKTGSFEPVSILSIELKTDNGTRVTRLQDEPVTWRFRAPAGQPAEDSIPVWVFNPDIRIWEPAGHATLTVSDTSRICSIGLNHFSLFAAGNFTQTRVVTGMFSFSFEKPFASPVFNAILTVTEPSTAIALQILAITVREDQPVPVELNVPVDRAVDLTVSASGDYEFSSSPSTFRVGSGQEHFTQSLSLRPLKCRFSGTIHGADIAGDMQFPTPAFVLITNDSDGSAYHSVPVSVTQSGFETPFSLMVYENQPVRIRIIPADLMFDFLTDPESIRIDSPCQENGSWNFNLTSNVCPVISTLNITLGETSLTEPVPVILRINRLSDGRQLLVKPVSLYPGTTAVPLTLPVPKNTPLELILLPAYDDRPISVLPASLIWEAPCIIGLSNGFTVMPGYVFLETTLDFTFDPALTLSEVPISLQVYRTAGEQRLFTREITVTRSQHQFIISRYVPNEPLILKITRANPDIRFNPVPFKVDIPDPSLLLPPFSFLLKPTELVPVHFLVKVVCPGGEVFPTVQGYYRIPGQDWHEMNIVSGNLTLTVEMGLTYEVGMILGGVMIDSVFTVTQVENNLTFPLEAADCERMGWK